MAKLKITILFANMGNVLSHKNKLYSFTVLQLHYNNLLQSPLYQRGLLVHRPKKIHHKDNLGRWADFATWPCKVLLKILSTFKIFGHYRQPKTTEDELTPPKIRPYTMLKTIQHHQRPLEMT